jgi:hypothetical protein
MISAEPKIDGLDTEYILAKLKAAQDIAENLSRRNVQIQLDAAEILLNDVARLYRDYGLPNRNRRYRAVSSIVAHARMIYNSR